MNPLPLVKDYKGLPGMICSIGLIVCLSACSLGAPVSPVPTEVPFTTTTPSTTQQPSAIPSVVPVPMVETATRAVPPTNTSQPTPSFPLPAVELVAVVLFPTSLPTPTPGPPPPRDWPNFQIEIYRAAPSQLEFGLSTEGISYDQPIFSPDGRWMAYLEEYHDIATGDGQARIRLLSTDWQTDQPLTGWFVIGRSSPWLNLQSWSPDSQWLAFHYWGKYDDLDRTYIVNANTHQVHLVGEPVKSVAWSDGHPPRLAYVLIGSSEEDGLYITAVDNLEQKQKVMVGNLPGNYLGTAAWSPDGSQLALCACMRGEGCGKGKMGLWLIDGIDLSARPVYSKTLDCGTMAWSPNGAWLVSYPGNTFALHTVFYNTTDWTLAQSPTGIMAIYGHWAGSWFLYTERYNRSQAPTSYQLVATTADGFKQILWQPEAALAERFNGKKVGVRGISWHVSSIP